MCQETESPKSGARYFDEQRRDDTVDGWPSASSDLGIGSSSTSGPWRKKFQGTLTVRLIGSGHSDAAIMNSFSRSRQPRSSGSTCSGTSSSAVALVAAGR